MSQRRAAVRASVATFVALLLVVLAAGSCQSATDSACELLCECEHCNDWRAEASCAELDYNERLAEAYDCSSQWEAWLACFEEQGICNEPSARFSTRQPGSCSEAFDTGNPCTGVSECESYYGQASTCKDGRCFLTYCAGGQGIPCHDGDDCPLGDDRCKAQKQALMECEVKASEVGPYLPHDAEQPQPAPGGPE